MGEEQFDKLVEEAQQHINKLEEDNYKIMNIDLTYVGQVPKLITHREEIRNNLSKVTKIDIENISCKATTTDGLGFEGKFEGISCHCVVLIER